MIDNTLSVVICTHNRADNMRTVLPSLFSQRLDNEQSLEIIVVANGCTDDTITTVVQLGSSSIFPIRCIELAEANLSGARNAGIEAATGEVIAFIDDDVRTYSDWASRIMQAFTQTNADIVGGLVELWFRDNEEPEWLDHYHRRLLSENIRGDKLRPANVADIFGCNFAVRRKVPETVGGFNKELGRRSNEKNAGEEADFITRALRRGFKPYYAPDARVQHLVTGDRLTEDYLTQCATGAGRAYSAINVGNDYDLKRLLEITSQLITLSINESKFKGQDYKKYIYYLTRRFHIYGELSEALRILFGSMEACPAVHGKREIPSYKELEQTVQALRHMPPATQGPGVSQGEKGTKLLQALVRASQLRRFDRNSSHEIVTPDNVVKPPYTVEIAFVANPLEGRVYHEYSDTSPPMPFLAGPALAIYQIAETRYSVGLGPGAKFRFEHDSGIDWMQVSLTVDKDLQANLFINGEKIAAIRFEKPEHAIIKTVHIGGGYKQRGWEGWVAHSSITPAIVYDMNFLPTLKPGKAAGSLVYFNGYAFE